MKNSLIFAALAIFGAQLPLGADAPAPPPAPAMFNTDAAPAPGAVGAPAMPSDSASLPAADATAGPADNGGGGGDSSDLAAPQISEDQMIKNAMEIADQLYHAEDYEGAGQSTAQILDKYPKRKLYWVRYLHALCLEHQALYDKAVEQYLLVKKEAPHSTYSNAASFRIGMSQMNSDKINDAIYTFHDIIDTNPSSDYRLQAYVHLGNLYRRTRHWREAEHIYKDLFRLYPDTSWAYTAMMYLAESYAYEGKPGKAIDIYQGMQRTDSVPVIFKAQAQLRIGEIHMNQKHWQESITAFRAALRDYSDVPGIELSAREKINQAEDSRRAGNVTYKNSRGPIQVITDSPTDRDYEAKQEKEATPY